MDNETLISFEPEQVRKKLNLRDSIFNPGLGRTLFIYIFLLTLIPLSILAVISYQHIEKINQQNLYQQLNTTITSQKNAISTYIGNLAELLKSQSESESTQYFLRDLHDSYNTSDKNLAKFVKSAQWLHISRLYQADMDFILNNKNVLDVYLVDTDGNILYSRAAKKDLGLNINSKQLASSHFAKAIKRNLKSGRMQFSDIDFYKFFNSEPAAFISQTVVNSRGKLGGTIVAQINLQAIDNVLAAVISQKTSSLQIFLLGEDGFMRNKLGNNDHTRLTFKINSLATNHWLINLNSSQRGNGNDKVFSETYNNADNESVLGVYQSLNLGGIRWALFAEISQQEVLQSVNELLRIYAVLISLTIIIILGVSLYLTRQIVNPLACLIEWARNISRGKLDMTYIISHEKEIDELNLAIIDIVKSQQQNCQTIASISQSHVVSDPELSTEINTLTKKIDTLCNQLTSTAQGEYKSIIKQLQSHTSNNSRFNQISVDIAQTFSDSELHRWLAEGKFNLLQCALKREQDKPLIEAHENSLNQFATEFITEICAYVDASVGLLYLANEHNTLILTGHYAYSETASTLNQFEVGEGVIGQVALQTQAIRINPLPDGYFDIEIGAGKISANTVIAAPFFYDNDIAGVIELVFTNKPDNKVELYLQNISSQAGNMFHDARLFHRLITLSSQALEQNNILTAENSKLESHNNVLALRLLAQKEELLAPHNGHDSSSPYVHATSKNYNQISEQRNLCAYIENISSALRTPLKRMLVLSQALTENTLHNLSKEQLESTHVIHRCGKELLNLIIDIYNLAQLEKDTSLVQSKSIDIAKLCELLRQEFTESTQQKLLPLRIHIHANVPKTVTGDQTIIREIIRHILIDSIKYTSSGSICLNVDLGSLDQDNSVTNGITDAVIFSISDTGMSIPNEDIDRIFESTKSDIKSIYRDNRGASIGLEISKRLSVLLGGGIKFYTKTNGGCRFDINIPIKIDYATHSGNTSSLDNEMQATVLEPKSITAHSTMTSAEVKKMPMAHNAGILLVVDDDRTRVKHLQKIVATSNFQCFVTESGENIETLVKLHNPAAIIVDSSMSNIDGSLVTTIISSSKKLKSIATYIYSREGNIIRSERSISDNHTDISSALDKLFHEVILTSNDSIKHILLVDKDISYQQSIANAIEDGLTKISIAGTATAAYNLLQENVYDCVILELTLPDLSGDKLLEQVAISDDIILPPVIIYTGKELDEKEHRCVSRYSDSILNKGDKDHHRLKLEIDAYLHTSESNLPPAMRQRVEMIHSEQQIMNEKSALLVDDDFLLTYPLSTALKQCGMSCGCQ